MNNYTLAAKGTLTPNTGPSTRLPSGDAAVNVEWVNDVGGMPLARVAYPGGLIKHHQLSDAQSVKELMQVVTEQFAEQFGPGKTLKSAPKTLKDNTTLTFGE